LKTYRGVLSPWFETGTEGIVWTLYEDGKKGYDAMRIIENGDRLKVWRESGEIVFDGEIVEDHKAGWEEYPGRPGFGQPSALGYWIHWTQRGWEPDNWAALFFNEYMDGDNAKPLRAELTKKGKPQA